jgi:hypothetical protein
MRNSPDSKAELSNQPSVDGITSDTPPRTGITNPTDFESLMALDSMQGNRGSYSPGKALLEPGGGSASLWSWTIFKDEKERGDMLDVYSLIQDIECCLDPPVILEVRLRSNVGVKAQGRADYIRVESGTRAVMGRMRDGAKRMFGFGGRNGNVGGYQ